MSISNYLTDRMGSNYKHSYPHDPYASNYGHGPIHSEAIVSAPSSYAAGNDNAHLLSGKIDWKETETEHIFKVELPGMKKEDVTVDLEGNRFIKITGEKWVEREDSTDPWRRIERTCARVVRSFRLPDDSKPPLMKASMENGVLTIRVPREEMKMNSHGSTRIPIY